MNDISPAKILQDVARSIPSEFHKLIVVVGSLAAGFHYFGNDKDREVRTKDIDCVVSPRVEAVATGKKSLNIYWKTAGNPYHTTGANFLHRLKRQMPSYL